MDTIDLLEMSSPFETEDGRRVTGRILGPSILKGRSFVALDDGTVVEVERPRATRWKPVLTATAYQLKARTLVVARLYSDGAPRGEHRRSCPKGRESGLTSQANLERLVEKLDRSQSPFSREHLCACLDD